MTGLSRFALAGSVPTWLAPLAAAAGQRGPLQPESRPDAAGRRDASRAGGPEHGGPGSPASPRASTSAGCSSLGSSRRASSCSASAWPPRGCRRCCAWHCWFRCCLCGCGAKPAPLAAWIGAGLFMVSPFAVEVAQFARFYAPQTLALFVAAILTYEALRHPGRMPSRRHAPGRDAAVPGTGDLPAADDAARGGRDRALGRGGHRAAAAHRSGDNPGTQAADPAALVVLPVLGFLALWLVGTAPDDSGASTARCRSSTRPRKRSSGSITSAT